MSKDKSTKGTKDTAGAATGAATVAAPAKRGRKAGVTMTEAQKAEMAANRVKNLIESDKLTNPQTWANVDPAKVQAIIDAATKGVENAKAAKVAALKAELNKLEGNTSPAPAADPASQG